MRIVSTVLTSGVLLACLVQAGMEQVESSLKEKIQESLENLLALEAQSQVHGIENCENKCDKAFNRFAYEISTTGGQETFEFRACVRGCNQCEQDLASNADPSNCFRTCKNFDWTTLGIVKGVIEPDKACIGGCVINTCQVICAGGTTDSEITSANRQFWYPNGGCSIKTQPYSQYLEYVPWNSPNTGQGGSQDVARCCANALSLCDYVGSEQSANFQQLLSNTANFCSEFVPQRTRQAICSWFRTPRNCGSL